jgi:hypothetical protein
MINKHFVTDTSLYEKVTEKDFPILRERRLRCPSLITIVSRKKDHPIYMVRGTVKLSNHDQSFIYTIMMS